MILGKDLNAFARSNGSAQARKPRGLLKYRFATYELDTQQRLLYCHGSLVDLAPKAIDLLCVLVENGGGVVSKEEISELVWKDTYID